jgi:hypothetical protein
MYKIAQLLRYENKLINKGHAVHAVISPRLQSNFNEQNNSSRITSRRLDSEVT